MADLASEFHLDAPVDEVVVPSTRTALAAVVMLTAGLMMGAAVAMIVLFLPRSLASSGRWAMLGVAAALVLVGRLLTGAVARRVRPGWTTVVTRRWWSGIVRWGGIGVSILWMVGVLVAETVGSRPGIGRLQVLLLGTGALGIIGALALGYFFASAARVRIPVVGAQDGDQVPVIDGLRTLSVPDEEVISGDTELTLWAGEDVRGRWWEMSAGGVLIPLGSVWVAVYDLGESSPTRGMPNLIHLALDCGQGCPRAVSFPSDVAVGILGIDRGGGVAMAAPPGAASPSSLESSPGVKTLMGAFRRDLSGGTLIESVGGSRRLSRKIVHRSERCL